MTTHAVYRFINRENEVIYVGMTSNLKARIAKHLSNESRFVTEDFSIEDIKRVDYLELQNEQECKLVEAYYINKHKPRFNISIPGEKIFIDENAHAWISFKLADSIFISKDNQTEERKREILEEKIEKLTSKLALQKSKIKYLEEEHAFSREKNLEAERLLDFLMRKVEMLESKEAAIKKLEESFNTFRYENKYLREAKTIKEDIIRETYDRFF